MPAAPARSPPTTELPIGGGSSLAVQAVKVLSAASNATPLLVKRIRAPFVS
jgi:hypothetical protein